MWSKNFRPKAIHKKFHNSLAKLGCIVTEAPAQLHHVVGASYRSNGVWVGQWWLIPLCPELHMDGNVNVTTNKTEFYEKVGSEKKLFWWTMEDYVYKYKDMPIPLDVIVEIYYNKENSVLEGEDSLIAFEDFINQMKMVGLEDIANETQRRIKAEEIYWN